MASMKLGHFLTVWVSIPKLGLKTQCGIVLSHSGRPSTAGNGRGTMVSSPGRQRNFNFIAVAWSMAHFPKHGKECRAYVRNVTEIYDPPLCAPIVSTNQALPV